jgi:hypothetical protein
LTGDPDVQQNAANMDMHQSTNISYIHATTPQKKRHRINVVALAPGNSPFDQGHDLELE